MKSSRSAPDDMPHAERRLLTAHRLRPVRFCCLEIHVWTPAEEQMRVPACGKISINLQSSLTPQARNVLK